MWAEKKTIGQLSSLLLGPTGFKGRRRLKSLEEHFRVLQ